MLEENVQTATDHQWTISELVSDVNGQWSCQYYHVFGCVSYQSLTKKKWREKLKSKMYIISWNHKSNSLNHMMCFQTTGFSRALVQDQDGWIAKQGASDGQALPLSWTQLFIATSLHLLPVTYYLYLFIVLYEPVPVGKFSLCYWILFLNPSHKRYS